MEKYLNNEQWHVEICKRCGDTHKVNRYGVCEMCDHEIDLDYAGLYGGCDMEN
jgi:transposase